MHPQLSEHRWVYSALVLGTGLLLIIAAGFALMWFVLLPLATLLPTWGVRFVWFTGPALSCLALWFLVDRCVRAGGVRALAFGLCGPVVVQLVFGRGALVGIGMIVALVVDTFLLVGLVMGVVAIRRAARATPLAPARQA